MSTDAGQSAPAVEPAAAAPTAEAGASKKNAGALRAPRRAYTRHVDRPRSDSNLHRAAKEAQKAAKLAKFAEKAAAKAAAVVGAPVAEKKVKGDKGTKAEEPQFVNTTPVGAKKGEIFVLTMTPNRVFIAVACRSLRSDERWLQPDRR